MGHTYNYVELSIFNHLTIGYEKSIAHHWGVLDHEGIKIHLGYLGYPESKLCYLPAKLLKKLYSNFDNYGRFAGLLFPNDMHMVIAHKQFNPETIDNMYEDKQGFICLNDTDEELGYPFLVPILPELKDINLLDELYHDPTLDVEMFYKVVRRLKGNVSNRTIYQYRHPRWSFEWLKYCERLVEQNPSMKILDKSYFLKLNN